jgi:hypothetical protein
MELSITNNYIATRMLSLDTHAIKASCYKLKEIVDKQFANDKQHYTDKHSPLTTNLFRSYNLMMYPFEGFHDLFTEISATFHGFRTHSKVEHTKFYMQCWLNVFKKGEYVDWHDHWLPEFHAWHGFYCVQVGDSNTTYRLSDGTHVEVTSIDNRLVLSKSGDDQHMSSPWTDTNMDRITIAFDILPDYTLREVDIDINHWIPI